MGCCERDILDVGFWGVGICGDGGSGVCVYEVWD